MNPYATWFSRVVWLGAIVDIFLAIPALLFPEWFLNVLHLEPAIPTVWLRFAANLVILISLFYISTALNFNYRLNALLTVFARIAGVTFFLTQPKAYLIFGAIDLVFAVSQGLLLWLALRQKS